MLKKRRGEKKNGEWWERERRRTPGGKKEGRQERDGMEATARRDKGACIIGSVEVYLLRQFVAFVYMFSALLLLVLSCNNSGFPCIGAFCPA